MAAMKSRPNRSAPSRDRRSGPCAPVALAGSSPARQTASAGPPIRQNALTAAPGGRLFAFDMRGVGIIFLGQFEKLDRGSLRVGACRDVPAMGGSVPQPGRVRNSKAGHWYLPFAFSPTLVPDNRRRLICINPALRHRHAKSGRASVAFPLSAHVVAPIDPHSAAGKHHIRLSRRSRGGERGSRHAAPKRVTACAATCHAIGISETR